MTLGRVTRKLWGLYGYNFLNLIEHFKRVYFIYSVFYNMGTSTKIIKNQHNLGSNMFKTRKYPQYTNYDVQILLRVWYPF